MEKFDLENFPTSESAKKMLGSVTEGFYDNSYVGKWIYQILGTEWDSAKELFDELPEQFFPETATWGLRFHEIKWGLQVRENLSYEERRRLIYQKRDNRSPMTPWRMEEYLADATGFDVHIADIHDPGLYSFIAPHPNVFKVYFLGEETLNSKQVHGILDRLKQSHTTYTVNDRIEHEIDNRRLEKMILQNVQSHLSLMFWYVRTLDGSWYLDGEWMLNAQRRYALSLGILWKFGIRHEYEQKQLHVIKSVWSQYNDLNNIVRIEHCTKVQNSVCVKHSSTFCMVIDSLGQELIGPLIIKNKSKGCWFLDGTYELDGSKYLDSIYSEEVIE